MLRGPAATPSVKNTCKLEASYIRGPRINYLHERNLQVSDRLAPGEMARKGGRKTTSTNLRAANKKKKKEKKAEGFSAGWRPEASQVHWGKAFWTVV